MQLGVYNAALHHLPLGEALDVVVDLGLTSVEINSGGFLPPTHLPFEQLRESQGAREDYLGEFSSRGLAITALNCNGNPLYPVEGFPHRQDLLDSIEMASLLGVTRVITMSGMPGAQPGATVPVWNVLPWWSPLLDVRDHQWEVAVPFWREVDAKAADLDVKVAIEMHPGNIVYNPATLFRLVEQTGATHIGAEMDPSHLFWQGIDPVAAVKALGDLVYIAAAKDTRINEAAKVNGVLDDRHERVAEGEADFLSLGGGTSLSRWPKQSSWDFVAVGRGHDVAFWADFLGALQAIDADMAVNIEHEDLDLPGIDGIRFATATLLEAQKSL